MKVLTFRSHKHGQGTSVTASAAAIHLAKAGHRVGLVTTDPDALALMGFAASAELYAETIDGLTVVNVAGQPLDAVALAGVCGLSDMPPRFDVIVTDLHDDTPSRADFARVWHVEAHAVEVVTADYLALRRSTQASHAGAERHHVVAIMEPARALTLGDIRSVLSPTGDVIEIPRDTQAARTVDAGLLANRLPKAFDALTAFVESLLIDPATLDAADRELAALKARRTAKGGTK